MKINFVWIIVLCTFICGCEYMKRGKPGEPGYIAPRYIQVKVIEYEPELIKQFDYGRTGIRQAYSVVEDEDGKRYRIIGKVGPVGDTFKMDVSLMKEVGS